MVAYSLPFTYIFEKPENDTTMDILNMNIPSLGLTFEH